VTAPLPHCFDGLNVDAELLHTLYPSIDYSDPGMLGYIAQDLHNTETGIWRHRGPNTTDDARDALQAACLAACAALGVTSPAQTEAAESVAHRANLRQARLTAYAAATAMYVGDKDAAVDVLEAGSKEHGSGVLVFEACNLLAAAFRWSGRTAGLDDDEIRDDWREFGYDLNGVPR